MNEKTPVGHLKQRIAHALRIQRMRDDKPRLRLNVDDTMTMQLATAFDVGDLVGEIATQGIERAMPRFFGIQVEWNASGDSALVYASGESFSL